MSASVEVTVTGTQRGEGPVVPYSHAGGLQFYYTPQGVRTQRPVTYDVPVYEVVIKGGASYVAVRFGLRNDGSPPLPVRPCDTGLSETRACIPHWLPHYSPHSFRGRSRPGAWQLLPGRGFLIHEGADRKRGEVAGSIGCVEILDGRWNEFLAEIETLGGGTCAEIAASSRLRVVLLPASYPVAKLRT